MCIIQTVGVYWELSQLSKASQTEEMMKEACLSVSQRPATTLSRFQKLLFMILLLKKKKKVFTENRGEAMFQPS